MRPTDIGLKSPANKTPFPSHPSVTRTGDTALLFKSMSGHSFASQKRFQQYNSDASKLGFRMGPGTYDLSRTSIGVARVRNTHLYKDNSYAKGRPQEGFYYSGNLLVYDGKLIPRSKVDQNPMDKRPVSSSSNKSFAKARESFRSAMLSLDTSDTRNSRRHE